MRFNVTATRRKKKLENTSSSTKTGSKNIEEKQSADGAHFHANKDVKKTPVLQQIFHSQRSLCSQLLRSVLTTILLLSF